MKAQAQPGRHKCKNKWCPNYYDDVIGGDNAFGKHKAGAECIPCLYADQMVEYEITIEQVEAVPALMNQFLQLLGNTGWTWEHMKESYNRRKAAAA